MRTAAGGVAGDVADAVVLAGSPTTLTGGCSESATKKRTGRGVSSTTHCPICQRVLSHVQRHVREAHLPWYWEPRTACWECGRQCNTNTKLTRHIEISGHQGGHFDVEQPSHCTRWASLVSGALRWLCRSLALHDLHALAAFYTGLLDSHPPAPIEVTPEDQELMALFGRVSCTHVH